MAHKVFLEKDGPMEKKRSRFKLPKISGRFGFGFSVGEKEVFVGVSVSNVYIEEVVRRKILPSSKGRVNVFKFD